MVRPYFRQVSLDEAKHHVFIIGALRIALVHEHFILFKLQF